ncbi:MAG: glycosyltransferase [Rhodospirillaceae bacterium]
MTARIAIVVKGYPRLSETFIAQEIRGLEQRGLDLRIVSLRHPTETGVHPVHDEIEAPVDYLPEYLWREPLRVLRAWRAMRRRPAYPAARRTWLRDLRRDRTPNRIRRFGQALVMAHELPADVGHIHVHFLHTPASVALYAAILSGLTWTGSAHAKDIWTSPEWEKREKLAHCRWLVTCSAHARDHLAALAPRPDTVELVYHGLDGGRFPPAPGRRPLRTGGQRSDPLQILCVGRAVEKKGHDILLEALARLPAGLHWRLTHVGGGPLKDRLRAQAARLGISGRISWCGALTQGEVIERYRAADLFVLASRVGRDGDRDGLPNVLMEAQSQGLACVASAVSAIPELILDGETGVLVPPEDADALSAAIRDLAANPERRLFLGRSGETRVRSAFSFAAGIDRLARKLGARDAGSGRNAA